MQTHPKLFIYNEQIPALKNFNFEMDSGEHKKELLDITSKILNKVDTILLH